MSKHRLRTCLTHRQEEQPLKAFAPAFLPPSLLRSLRLLCSRCMISSKNTAGQRLTTFEELQNRTCQSNLSQIPKGKSGTIPKDRGRLPPHNLNNSDNTSIKLIRLPSPAADPPILAPKEELEALEVEGEAAPTQIKGLGNYSVSSMARMQAIQPETAGKRSNSRQEWERTKAPIRRL